MSKRSSAHGIEKAESAETSVERISEWISMRKNKIKLLLKIFLLLLYLAYYGYAMYCSFGDEESIRLTVFTGFGLYMLAWRRVTGFESVQSWLKKTSRNVRSTLKYGRRPLIIKWLLYLAMAAVVIQHLIRNVALKEPFHLMSLAGISASIVLMVILSRNRRRINWHTVYVGMWLQFILGYVVLNWNFGRAVLTWMTDRLTEFLGYAFKPAVFIFGPVVFGDNSFALFKVIPSIIIYCSATQVLIYLGVVQWLVRNVGKGVAFAMDVSAPEAMCATANILLGLLEAAVIIIECLADMPTSHLFTVIVGGLASSAGAQIIQLMALGVPATYLLSASTMSAPAAVVCSKILYPDEPEVDPEDWNKEVSVDVELVNVKMNKDLDDIMDQEDNTRVNSKETKTMETKDIATSQNNNIKSIFPQPKNIGEAMIAGGKMGLVLFVGIFSTVVVFMAALEMADKTFQWFAARVNVDTSLRETLSYVFYPFAFLLGIRSKDCLVAADLLGYWIVSIPMLAYTELVRFMSNRQAFESYTMDPNNTWSMRGDDIFLDKLNQTLKGGFIEERTEVIMTYVMCGNATLVTIGIGIGALGSIVPKRIPELMKMGPRALIGGSLACYLTACVAGLFL